MGILHSGQGRDDPQGPSAPEELEVEGVFFSQVGAHQVPPLPEYL